MYVACCSHSPRALILGGLGLWEGSVRARGFRPKRGEDASGEERQERYKKGQKGEDREEAARQSCPLIYQFTGIGAIHSFVNSMLLEAACRRGLLLAACRHDMNVSR